MFTVYLCGFMSGRKLTECTEWRKQIREYFNLNPKWHGQICFYDPFNGQERQTIDKEGLCSSIPGPALVARDYAGIKASDLIVANLNTFGETRPLTGSIYELAWAWLEHKPVIIITQDKNYIQHPFIQSTASMIVPDVKTLLKSKYIQYFYQGRHSATY